MEEKARMEERKGKSRKEALEKIISILSEGSVDERYLNVSGNYYSSDKFIVSWIGTWNGMIVEYSIDKVDSFYSGYSGYKAVYVRRNLFMEKQIDGYHSIERALIEVGIKLCQNRESKRDFFSKFAIPYNQKLKMKEINQQ